jgi:hypothetical protein
MQDLPIRQIDIEFPLSAFPFMEGYDIAELDDDLTSFSFRPAMSWVRIVIPAETVDGKRKVVEGGAFTLLVGATLLRAQSDKSPRQRGSVYREFRMDVVYETAFLDHDSPDNKFRNFRILGKPKWRAAERR